VEFALLISDFALSILDTFLIGNRDSQEDSQNRRVKRKSNK